MSDVDNIYDVFYEPNLREISKILIRKNRINKHYSSLYRRLKDIQGYSKKRSDIIDNFIQISQRESTITPFDAIMFFLYVNLTFDFSDDSLKDIRENLSKHQWATQGSNNRASFDSIHDGMRWLLSYRCTISYLQNILRKY